MLIIPAVEHVKWLKVIILIVSHS